MKGYTCHLDGRPLTVEMLLTDEAALAAMVRAVGSAPTRFSSLKRMADSPLWYLLEAYRSLTEDLEETISSKLGAGPGRDRQDALRFGTAIHRMVLGTADKVAVYSAAERDRYAPSKPERKGRGVAALLDPVEAEPKRVTRQGAAWAAYEAEQIEQGRVILLEREFAEARSMADMILRSPRACELLFDGTILEQRIDWRIRGRGIRSTPDARKPGVRVVDLKSCADSSPRRFVRQIYEMLYHAQLEAYCQASQHVDGTRPGEAWIVAIDRKRPPRCYRVTDDGLELGARCLGSWIETLLTCEASGHFPFDGVHEAPPPEYMTDVEVFDVAPEETP